MPRTLSGGERQRVALARSLAAEPRLLLLDEPLSSLDAELRVRLAADLRRILREAGTTALLVTHDQEEAFAVADRLAVMRDGAVVQQGTTEDVWASPADAATALFLGYARVLTGGAAHAVLAAAGRPAADAIAVRRSALAARRAEAGAAGARGLTATVRAVRATPDEVRLVVDIDGIGEADAVGAPGWLPAPGDPVVLRVDPARLAVLPSVSAPKLCRVYRRAYSLLIGTAVALWACTVFVSLKYDRPPIEPEGKLLGPSLTWVLELLGAVPSNLVLLNVVMVIDVCLRALTVLVAAVAVDLVVGTLVTKRGEIFRRSDDGESRLARLRAGAADRWRTRWTRERTRLVAVGMLFFYLTYVCYRNLKSDLPFVAARSPS